MSIEKGFGVILELVSHLPRLLVKVETSLIREIPDKRYLISQVRSTIAMVEETKAPGPKEEEIPSRFKHIG